MKREYWKLSAILLISAILRCIALQSRGIWYDDAFSIFLSRQPLGAIISGTAADTMPIYLLRLEVVKESILLYFKKLRMNISLWVNLSIQ